MLIELTKNQFLLLREALRTLMEKAEKAKASEIESNGDYAPLHDDVINGSLEMFDLLGKMYEEGDPHNPQRYKDEWAIRKWELASELAKISASKDFSMDAQHIAEFVEQLSYCMKKVW